jgi:hypothetical protein
MDPVRAAAEAIRARPIDRNDPALQRTLALALAVEREGSLRRAWRSVAKKTLPASLSHVGSVAAIAAVLDAECDDRGRTPMSDIAIRSLVEALLDRSDRVARGFAARVVERWILSLLGDAPLRTLTSVSAHAEFRAELASHVRRCVARIEPSPTMLASLEEALHG